MTRIEFTAVGDPVPQGSTRSFARNGRVITTNDPTGRLERWRGDIRSAATAAGMPCLEGPVAIAVDFRIRRPAAHFLPVTRTRQTPLQRPEAPEWHNAKPDVDKLVRGVLDALTNVAWADDRQVVVVHATKRWAATPGVTVAVSEVLA